MINGTSHLQRDFDMVMVCLPHNWLSTVEWGNEKLRRAMVKHIRHFDRPAHYLRVIALFDTPFWEGKVKGSWFMTDAFGGACVYIEGSRHNVGKKGVLNWLIAGSDALAYVNLPHDQLIDTALKTLPKEFGDARQHLVEARVVPWISSVNALPGGLPVRDALTNHVPEPKEHPGLIVVGDYLFDSTLNGLLDSSDMASDIVLTQVMRRRYETVSPNKWRRSTRSCRRLCRSRQRKSTGPISIITAPPAPMPMSGSASRTGLYCRHDAHGVGRKGHVQAARRRVGQRGTRWRAARAGH